MATYRPDGTRIRKRDKKGVDRFGNKSNVGVGTSTPTGNVGAGSSAPEPPPPGPIVSDDRDAEGNIGVGTTH